MGILHRILPGALGIFVLTSWISGLFGFDLTATESENRKWANTPGMDVLKDDPVKYGRQWSAYFADHFGFRSSLLWAHNKTRFAVFGASSTRDVVVGKNGWLFWGGQGSTDFNRNINPFSATQLESLVSMFEKADRWLNSLGIEFIVFIPPDSPSVYPEMLPDWLRVEQVPTRRMQLIQATRQRMRAPIVDLVPPLKESQKIRRPYYKTDSHWNNWGGYVAFGELVKVMRANTKYLEKWPPFDAAQFEFREQTERGQDMARLLGLQREFLEIVPVLESNSKRSYYTKDIRPTNPDFDHTTVCETCAGPRALFIRDSFGLAISPLASSYFREVLYVWDNTIPVSLVLDYRPDIVVMQFVERKLIGLPPSQIPEVPN